jgi:hypothetical protein
VKRPVLILVCLAALCFHAAAAGPTPDRGAVLRKTPFTIGEEDRSWWAFQPVRRPAIPTGSAHPIDALLGRHLKERGWVLSAPASRREQLRRLHADLVGLPPTLAEVEAYEQDGRPDAWEKRVEDLLGRPGYGERWARHWLDLVRYAESNGYERDGVKPEAWRYRDYVVSSFNEDKPYDRFVLEQLAGDELPGFSPEAIIATGVYRLHVWDDEPDNTRVAEFDELDDILVTTSSAFLGLTLGCARCHDHKFDPFSQADYYRFLAYFRSIHPYGLHHTGGGGRGTGRITRPLVPDAEFKRWKAERDAEVRAMRGRLAGVTEPTARRAIEDDIRRVEARPAPFPFALAISEDAIQATHVLKRGDVMNPGEEVQPSMPFILGVPSPDVVAPGGAGGSSGRRLAMARWMVDARNPLTARVMVNRIWQHHFGVGLVPTPNDLGRTGLRPTHPELLDWLADEFIRSGWRIKHIHRLILTSAAYRMSSRATGSAAMAADEGNTHLWRQNPRRLEGEALRDTLLWMAGALNRKVGGPSFFPGLAREVHGTQDSAGKGWGESPVEEQGRRTIYAFAKRALVPPVLEVFDCPASTVSVGMRSVTTVAPQSLTLLNDPFVREQAARFATRLEKECGEEDASVVMGGFAIALQRVPREEEMKASLRMLAEQRRLADGKSPPERGRIARVHFCAALMNLNELLHVD